ncbi:hypothetical protein GQ600_14650 [Phytophthora cactorum]|nr:hypothetical protein GQ600_14650 [Phytophthora cactorum]
MLELEMKTEWPESESHMRFSIVSTWWASCSSGAEAISQVAERCVSSESFQTRGVSPSVASVEQEVPNECGRLLHLGHRDDAGVRDMGASSVGFYSSTSTNTSTHASGGRRSKYWRQ